MEEAPTLEKGPLSFKPDLLARRGGKLQAVRVDDDPLGAYPIGAFAAMCKKFHVPGVVICPGSQEVVDSCRERGVDFLSPEGLGEAWFPQAAPPTLEPMEAAASTPAAPTARGISTAREARAWRWIVVALIWLAALYFGIRLILDVIG